MFYIITIVIATAIMILIANMIFDFDSDSEEGLSSTQIILVVILAMGAMMMVINMLMGDFGMRRSGRIFSIANVEERAKKLEELGVEKLLKDSKAKILDISKRGNSLYVIDQMIPNYELKYLVYEDPSTKGKIYGCFVPSDFTTADQAMAWKWEITEEEYQNDLIYEA